jgi:alkanesulfonate monooxygenase SsuD/methylene tetrahydromethanopterin reductase-like flavin-dependent oxidoreductase (luciferase family)
MDHFWQIRGVGPAEHEMLEAYTALAFLAAHTSTAKLHTLVTGGGEKKTLRLVARYADACNIGAGPKPPASSACSKSTATPSAATTARSRRPR